jgi:hypothetical protein
MIGQRLRGGEVAGGPLVLDEELIKPRTADQVPPGP